MLGCSSELLSLITTLLPLTVFEIIVLDDATSVLLLEIQITESVAKTHAKRLEWNREIGHLREILPFEFRLEGFIFIKRIDHGQTDRSPVAKNLFLKPKTHHRKGR